MQVSGYSSGLNAYDAWIKALQQPVDTDLFFLAMNADVVAEARKHASGFFKQSLSRQEMARIRPTAKEDIESLANLYREISECWSSLAKLLWRSRENKLPIEHWQHKAICLLTVSKQSEEQAALKAAELLEKVGHENFS